VLVNNNKMAISLAVAIASVTCIALIWLVRINLAMHAVPAEAAKVMSHRWTRKEIQETYERVRKSPVDFSKHLPPRLDRRYVVVGGAGMVGGDVVLQLLQRGQTPQSIRIVDFQGLTRRDMLEKANVCDFVKTDMTSWESVQAAFSKPWPAAVAKLPLTVYHTAAKIAPGDRSERLYERLRRVNVGGTENVLKASKAVGADIFVATASASISFPSANFWIWPWQSIPENYFVSANQSGVPPSLSFFCCLRSQTLFRLPTQ
jgi:FlaA1/EpsC-like NDP-sugar epimerase